MRQEEIGQHCVLEEKRMLHEAERAEPRYNGFGRWSLYSDSNTSSEEGYRDNGDCVNSQASGRSRKRVSRVAETRWGHRRLCCDRPFSSKGQSGWEIRDLKRAGNRVRWEEIQNDTEVQTIQKLWGGTVGCDLQVDWKEWCHSFWEAFGKQRCLGQAEQHKASEY